MATIHKFSAGRAINWLAGAVRGITMENYIKADYIANNAGIKHESINRAIARHRDQLQTFGPLGRTKGGKHGRTVYYWLNRAQAALLVTMLKNSGAGVRLKATLLTELLA